MNIPRLMLTAPASGSGKTLLTCGILQALIKRGLSPCAFKCGPDYIDPMFHRTVLGTQTGNLDTFFTDEETTRRILARGAAGRDLALLEGVMGFYDGLGTGTKGSAYDIARVTGTPCVLVVNARGMSFSLAALIRGFASFKEGGHVRGVILNQMSPALYDRLKGPIEKDTGIRLYGCLPRMEEAVLESRHLGLVMPEEIGGIREKLDVLADEIERRIDLDGLIALAQEAPDLEAGETDVPGTDAGADAESIAGAGAGDGPVIAVARDEAFCFYYRENLELLERLGARLEFFSPLRDAVLPKAGGLLLGGGYPEIWARELSANEGMRRQIAEALSGGMPCLAECGGFMYLQEQMEDMEGRLWPMAGFFSGVSRRQKKAVRFGYITMEANPGADLPFGDPGQVRAHEFHYYDSTDNGALFHARKAFPGSGWDCMRAKEKTLAGYPHLYYAGCPALAKSFLTECVSYARRRGGAEAGAGAEDCGGTKA